MINAFLLFFIIILLISISSSSSPAKNSLAPGRRYLVVDDAVVERLSEVTGLDIDANGNLVDREHLNGFTGEKGQRVKETYLADYATATAAANSTKEPE